MTSVSAADRERLFALCEDPSPETWRALCELINDQPRSTQWGDLLDALDARLDAAWPDELRATMCGMSWDENILNGYPDPRHRLVRELRYNSVFVGRYGGIMSRSPSYRSGTITRNGAVKHWDHLSSIVLTGQRLSSDDLRALAQAPMPRLTNLVLNNASAEDLEGFQSAPWIGRLERFCVSSVAGGPEGASAVGRLPFGPLRKLTLGEMELSEASAKTLACSEALEELDHLVLYSPSNLDAGAARGLSAGLPRLRELYISSGGVGAEALDALLSGRLQPAVLTLSESPLGDDGAAALARTGRALEEVSLSHCNLTDAGLEALGNATQLDRLHTLSASRSYGKFENALTSVGLEAILDGPGLPGLRSLNLHGAFEYVHGRNLHNLTALTLSGLASSVDAAALGASLNPSLTALTLTRAGWSPDDIRALLAPMLIAPLHTLDLSESTVDAEALAPLRRARDLHTLNLNTTNLTADALAVILASGAPLQQLRLRGNPLGDDAAVAIAASPHLTSLRTLDLSGTKLTDRGAIALAQSPHLNHIERLNLDNNAITDAGAQAIAKRLLPGGGWMSASLYSNSDITQQGRRALDKAPPRCCP